MSIPTLLLNRGSDMDFSVSWPATDGSALDLTGYTVSAFEATAALAPHLTLTLTAPTTMPQITGRIDWDASLEDEMFFRVRISLDGDDLTTPAIRVLLR